MAIWSTFQREGYVVMRGTEANIAGIINPEHYAAIHFHDDDLYDCAWESDFEVRLPDNISSGVYAIHLHSGSEEYYIPFSVPPPRGTKTAPVAFILPTASYMAYANNRMGIDVPETEIVTGRLIQMNPIDLFMQTHPEIGLCFYDLHNDGSGVFYSSRLRPIVNFATKTNRPLRRCGFKSVAV